MRGEDEDGVTGRTKTATMNRVTFLYRVDRFEAWYMAGANDVCRGSPP